MAKHWTERLFLEAGHLWVSDLEQRVEKAKEEASALVETLSEHEVPSGASVLDVPCGIGRHSVALAELGYGVVGVDLSPEFIERAREMAEERGVAEGCDFRVGDMRRIGDLLEGFGGRFDAVIVLYTSMGYYDEDTDREFLAQLLGLAAPGGVLVVEGAPRDRFVRQMWPAWVGKMGEDLLLVEESRLDLESSRVENLWRYYREKDDGDLELLETVETSHRVYSLHEAKRMLEETGWTYEACYGNWEREPYTLASRGMLLVAKKP